MPAASSHAGAPGVVGRFSDTIRSAGKRSKWDANSGPRDANGNPTSLILAGYFKMRSRFVDYPGYFVLHCHILAHEDRGMMTTVQVTL